MMMMIMYFGNSYVTLSATSREHILKMFSYIRPASGFSRRIVQVQEIKKYTNLVPWYEVESIPALAS